MALAESIAPRPAALKTYPQLPDHHDIHVLQAARELEGAGSKVEEMDSAQSSTATMGVCMEEICECIKRIANETRCRASVPKLVCLRVDLPHCE